MKSWINLVIKWFIVGLLGLANAANAAQVTAINFGGGTAAVRADGVLLGWGTIFNNVTTTPVWMAMQQNIISVTPDASYAVQMDGSVLDLAYGSGVVPGLSPVQAVIVPPQSTMAMGMGGRPSFVQLRDGRVRAIMTVMGMSGVQTFIQGFNLGLSGVATAVSGAPRESGLPNESWVWAVGSDGNLYDGRSTYILGFGISNVGAVIAGLSNVTGVVDLPNTTNLVHNNNTFVVKSDGTVWAWGPQVSSNGAFNAAAGAPVAGTLSPVQVPGLANVVSLAAGVNGGWGWGSGSVYALTATGDVWAWGDGESGQLGDNQNSLRSNNGFAPFPVQVQGLSNVAKIVANGRAVLALTADGSVWGWGDNFSGQLGDGTNITRYAPVQVGGLSPLTGVTSLDLSAEVGVGIQLVHAVAAKADGSVWTWGDNTVGQLGDGTRVNRNAPVRVLGEGGVGFLTVQPAILTALFNGLPPPPNSYPLPFNFGNVAVGTPSTVQTITFTNVGLVTWTGFSFLPSQGDFSQTNGCGVSLVPGASCTLSIRFTPTRAGLQTVTTNLINMGNSNLVGSGSGGLTLTGTGVGPQAVLSSSLGFGIQKNGTTTTKAVTLSNAGSAVLTVGTPGVTGAGFTLGTTTCGATLAAGASCTLNVNFAPVANVAYAGTLTFTGSNNPPNNPPGSTPPSMALSGTGAATATTRGDFNANGMADILLRDMATGADVIWLMNGGAIASYAYIYTVPPQWTVAGVLDFNGDATSDILWRDSLTGTNALWFMNGTAITSGSVINSATPDWSIAGTGDFNGDGQNDILWINNNTRQVAVWLMNAGQVVSAGFAGSVAQGWSIAGVGDFDGDGKADILWRNQATGVNSLWYMNGTAMRSAGAVTTLPSNWNIAGVADFNGDGKADILWRDPAAGSSVVWLMNGNTMTSYGFLPTLPAVWAVAKVADFNGDGKADIMWRDTSGNNAIWFMNGTLMGSYVFAPSVATSWTVIKK